MNDYAEVYDLGVDRSTVKAYADALGIHNHREALAVLADTLSRDPWWESLGPVKLVAAPGNCPGLALFGQLTPDQRFRLAARAGALRRGCRRLRYLRYSDAEQAAAELADRLLSILGRPLLESCRFAAIPRGGWLVLGMLAYHLDLSARHLMATEDATGPTILVDDCALSGGRVARWLEAFPRDEVVVAHLFSHPELRSAMLEQEPRVVACIAAGDLQHLETGPAHPDDPEWCAHWSAHLEGKRYWAGATEHLCFPWSEPERLLIDFDSGTVDSTWRIVPAAYCLGNRHRLARRYIELEILPEFTGPLLPAPGVVYAEFDGDLVVADLTRGERLGLSGSGADFWKALVESGSVEGAAARLTLAFGEVEGLSEDVAGFTRELMQRGWLRDTRAAEPLGPSREN